ncbi:MAG: hypothetical protein MJ239_05860 [Bacilli bacterium]|nr:hypothetical protein [Bacilli bacterium]
MKNKSKLLLATSVLTAATIAAGATGTFAWFTTNRTASVTITNITAKANNSTLKVDLINAYNDSSFTKETVGDSEVNATSASNIADVSSEKGLVFTQAVFVSGTESADTTGAGDGAKLSKIKQVNNTEKCYTQYYLTITNVKEDGATTGKALDVYLGENTKITAGGANQKDLNLAGWSRVAIASVGTAKPASVPTAEGDGVTNIVTFKTSISGAAGVVTAGKYLKNEPCTAGDLYTNHLGTATIKTDAFPTVTGTSETPSGNNYLGEIAPGATQYYLVSVWMEGTEAMNQNSAKDGIMGVSLDIRAFDAE